jgi:hypothetical protein
MTARHLLAPCMGAALIGGALFEAGKRSDPPPAAIVTDVQHGGTVQIEPLFWRNNCQFYRVTDAQGVHYAGTGYIQGEGLGHVAISCTITP